MTTILLERYTGPAHKFMAGRLGLPDGELVQVLWPELAAAWAQAGNPRPLMVRHRQIVEETIGDAIRDGGGQYLARVVEVFVP